MTRILTSPEAGALLSSVRTVAAEAVARIVFELPDETVMV